MGVMNGQVQPHRKTTMEQSHRALISDPWIDIPAFDLVRDPARWPSNDSHVARIFDATVERYRAMLLPLGVLHGLSNQHQRELAAKVLDLEDFRARWQASHERDRGLRTLATRGPAHVRSLERQLAKLQAGLTRLVEDAAKVHPFFEDRIAPRVRRAQAALSEIDLVRADGVARSVPMNNWFDEAAWQLPDPKPIAARDLVTYFRACGLSAADATVRTAAIGNARWDWCLQIAETDYGVKDCPAVRALIRRLDRRRRRTPEKKRP
jgi:hypothetical protein